MKGFPDFPVSCHAQGALRHVPDMNERANGMAAAVQRKFFAQKNVKDCPWDNAEELLSRPEHIRRPGEGHWKMIVPDESAKMQFATGTRGCIGRAGIERRFLGNVPATAAINLGSRDMDILLEEIEMAKSIVEAHVRDDVRLIPVLGMQPALRDHALGNEINDVIGLEIADAPDRPVEVVVEIELLEAEISAGTIGPFVRKKHRIQFRRAADAQDVEAKLEQIIDEMTSGEGIASQNNGSL
jgi:hypothetical protein